MSGRVYSQEYLDGIRDERALLRSMQSRGEFNGRADALAILANIESTLARFHGGPVADSLRGGRDFWRNQLRRMPA